MGEFVLIVEFDVKPDCVDRFIEIVTENALASVRDEPGCRQFDVLQSPDEANRIVLYEVYDDAACFDAHRTTPHFATFDGEVGELIAGRGARRLGRIAGGGGA